MFESDDFDQVLSQFDFPEVAAVKPKENDTFVLNLTENSFCKPTETTPAPSPISPGNDRTQLFKNHNATSTSKTESTPVFSFKKASGSAQFERSQNENLLQNDVFPSLNSKNSTSNITELNTKPCGDLVTKEPFVSPKHTKRKIINSYFDHQSKRKFPGPAGLLSGALDEPEDESICQIELLSQDIDCTEHNLRNNLFDCPLWKRLLSETQDRKLVTDSIKVIKQQALAGNLRKRKAQTVTAFVDAVDRSATDPLIILRDSTGTIKCTLHRDAWSTFSPYIMSEYCALVLYKPTVLTTGSAYKKHYLNITLSNILAIYSSSVMKEDVNNTLPEGYHVVYEEDFTVIKTERCSDSLGTPLEQSNGAEDIFDDIDSFFSDDIF